jgi:hypothetical protein
MATYDPSDHPRLSAEALALDQPVLDAYADEAEALFGIAGTEYTGVDAQDLTLAVVRQVNLTVRLENHGAGVLQAESKGDQSYTMARNPRTGELAMVDAIAQRIVDRVTALPVGGVEDGGDPPYASTSTPIVFSW